MGMHTAI